MRELLFRGQTRKNGEKVRVNGEKVPGNWVYGGVCQGVGAHSIIYGNDDVELKKPTGKWVVHSDTLGQSTGLTDKNGKKIFEGDIVRHMNKETMVVVWNKDFTSFALAYSAISFNYLATISTAHIYLEVIGNIHDNPELLEVE